MRLTEHVHGVVFAAALAREAHALMKWPLHTHNPHHHPSQHPACRAINTPSAAVRDALWLSAYTRRAGGEAQPLWGVGTGHTAAWWQKLVCGSTATPHCSPTAAHCSLHVDLQG
jgi:hypothetical protein